MHEHIDNLIIFQTDDKIKEILVALKETLKYKSYLLNKVTIQNFSLFFEYVIELNKKILELEAKIVIS